MVAAISASCERAKESIESTAVIIQASMPTLDINEIRAILPHRYPFLLVDRIVEMEPERIVGIKNVTLNEPFFIGHFPDFPVVPGDTLRLEMRLLKRKASVAKMAGLATVDGLVVAEAEMMCKLADKEEKQPANSSV